MSEITTDIEDMVFVRIEPLQHIVELIERYSGTEKTVIALSIAAGTLLDDLHKCICRLNPQHFGLIEEGAKESPKPAA